MMISPAEKRDCWRGGILQIHVTRACELACIGCTQGSNLSGKVVTITLDNFEKAVQSLSDYWGVVGIFGGNPCLHPKFPEICEILSSYIPFEQRGIWTNNLHGHGKLCRKTFNPEYSNLNVHLDMDAYLEMLRDWPESHPKGLMTDCKHPAPYVAIKDLIDIDRNEKWRLIENCDINKNWSAMICQFRGELRGYFCEIAGAQSMLHQAETHYPDTGTKITPGWWDQPISAFAAQIIHHCPDCGIPLRGFSSLAVTGDTEYVSRTHMGIYVPKRNGHMIKLVNRKSEMEEQVTCVTNYIENGLRS